MPLSCLGQEWLDSTITNRHSVASFDFASQRMKIMVVGQTLARGGTLHLLMTDVPDLVWVAVVVPMGNSRAVLASESN